MGWHVACTYRQLVLINAHLTSCIEIDHVTLDACMFQALYHLSACNIDHVRNTLQHTSGT